MPASDRDAVKPTQTKQAVPRDHTPASALHTAATKTKAITGRDAVRPITLNK